MEKYFEKLIKDYGKVLTEELGDENLKKRLLKRLEEILGGNNLSGETSQDLFNKLIDYNSILKKVKFQRSLVRIENAFEYQRIKTYGDLQRGCYDYFKNKEGGIFFWKNEKTYTHYLNGFRNLGHKGIDSMIFHLKSINFDFSEESAKKAFEKNN